MGSSSQLPKISIITPSFNQGNYLEETINSIISQEYPNYELIIMDAASTDNTIEVIRNYEPYITHWVSEKDRGQSHAIQKGLAYVTGDIVNWLNSDDLLAPGALHAIAREFDLERYDVMCGNCDYFVNDLAHMDLRNERMGLSATVGDTIMAGKINQPSTFFKASIFRELGVDEQFHFTMDLDLWYRYLLRNGQQRVLLSDSLLTYFRLHEASKTVALSPRFEGDSRKVLYNIFFSLDMPEAFLNYLQIGISDSKFIPKQYPINIKVEELHSLIHTHAWSALIYYNEIKNQAAARVCLRIALKYRRKLDMDTVMQYIKHFIVPAALLK